MKDNNNSPILIDNYDSFTYNIVHYLRDLGCTPLVFKNDEIDICSLSKMNFHHIILSPGPSNPKNAGISLQVIESFYKTKNILGICLGHQCIGHYFGANVREATMPMHGKVSRIRFNPHSKIYAHMKQDFLATRYHSLIVDDVIAPLRVNAMSEDGVIMGIEHNTYNVFGVQFHPESILSEFGTQLLYNFLYAL